MIAGADPSTGELGVYLPELIAAEAVTILNVDPGGYEDWVARLKKLQVAAPQCCPFGLFGLNVGFAYMASTAPVRGCRATTAPTRPASWERATSCAFGSRVVCSVSPTCGALESGPNTELIESVLPLSRFA